MAESDSLGAVPVARFCARFGISLSTYDRMTDRPQCFRVTDGPRARRFIRESEIQKWLARREDAERARAGDA